MKCKNPYAFVIFDWDGTLMDSTDRIVSAMQTAAKNTQLQVPTESDVKGIIGLSMEAIMQKLFPNIEEQTKKDFFIEYRFQYVEGDKTPTALFDGVLDLLNWLQEREVTVAIATGKARFGLERVLKDVGLENYFKYSICSDEAESKPHPGMIQKLLQKTQHNQQETIVIGDSVHDLNMANNAGVDSAGVTSGANDYQTLEALKPKAIFEQVTQFKDWFADQ